jgi:hypothetical protein
MKIKIAFAALVLLTVLPVIYGFKTKPQLEELTLKQAMVKGYIQCSFQNNKGYTHYSQCLLAEIKNTSSRVLSIKIDNGMQVCPDDSIYQNLIVTENLFVTINPQQSITVPIYAMCTEPHDRAPGNISINYKLAKDASGVMKAVTEFIMQNKYHNSEGQEAVWCVAANEDLDAISGYDTIAVAKLQGLISKLTGKKIPPPPAPDDYKRNYYAHAYTPKITLGGNFQYNFAKARNRVSLKSWGATH